MSRSGAGWSFVAQAALGFDPYSLQLANGPYSQAMNTQTPLPFQSANGDSSRAGQWDNSVGFIGVSNPTYGTLTVGRQNTLTLDGVNAYDPMGGSYAFSPIGYSGKVAGAGWHRRSRAQNTAVKYAISVGNFRAGRALPVRRLRAGQRLERRVRRAIWRDLQQLLGGRHLFLHQGRSEPRHLQ